MQIHQSNCPNCSKPFYFPVDYPGERFRIICKRCYLGYDLVAVRVDEALLDNMLFAHRIASWLQKPQVSQKLFQYLRSVALEFRFAPSAHSNAVVFLVAQMRSDFPIAVYFQSSYHRIRPLNRLLFSISLAAIGALFLLGQGMSLIPVIIGATGALFTFWQFTALPKINRLARNRLLAEQTYLKQCYELEQNLNRIHQTKHTHQNYLQSLQSVLELMLQNPQMYPTQIDLYQRAIQCTNDYLNLCDCTVAGYEAAIRAAIIGLETSKLSAKLSSSPADPRIDFGLEQLEDQLANSVPTKLFNHNHETDDHPTS